MKCPNCTVDLSIGERAGLSIDFCPKCRGIWLEKDKLDQIIDRSSGGGNDGSNDRRGQKRDNEDEGFFGKMWNMFD